MSELVVVDASLALKWVIPETDSNTAIGLLDKWTVRTLRTFALLFS